MGEAPYLLMRRTPQPLKANLHLLLPRPELSPLPGSPVGLDHLDRLPLRFPQACGLLATLGRR